MADPYFVPLIVQIPVAPGTTPAGIDPVDPPDVAEGMLDELELPEPDEPLDEPDPLELPEPLDGTVVAGVDPAGSVVPLLPDDPLPPDGGVYTGIGVPAAAP